MDIALLIAFAVAAHLVIVVGASFGSPERVRVAQHRTR